MSHSILNFLFYYNVSYFVPTLSWKRWSTPHPWLSYTAPLSLPFPSLPFPCVFLVQYLYGGTTPIGFYSFLAADCCCCSSRLAVRTVYFSPFLGTQRVGNWTVQQQCSSHASCLPVRQYLGRLHWHAALWSIISSSLLTV